MGDEMKVGGSNTAVHFEAYAKHIQQRKQLNTVNDPVYFKKTAQEDKIELSRHAREVQQAARMLKQMPEVRGFMVQQVRMQVGKGTYKVVGAQVSMDMLRESLENNLILEKIDSQA